MGPTAGCTLGSSQLPPTSTRCRRQRWCARRRPAPAGRCWSRGTAWEVRPRIWSTTFFFNSGPAAACPCRLPSSHLPFWHSRLPVPCRVCDVSYRRPPLWPVQVAWPRCWHCCWPSPACPWEWARCTAWRWRPPPWPAGLWQRQPATWSPRSSSGESCAVCPRCCVQPALQRLHGLPPFGPAEHFTL